MNSEPDCKPAGLGMDGILHRKETIKNGLADHFQAEIKQPGGFSGSKRNKASDDLPGDMKFRPALSLTKGGRPAKKRGPKKKSYNDESGLISLSKAAAIFRELTGRRKSLKVLADIIHERPHLAVFDFDLTSCRPHFLGVRRDRWVYFLKTRFLMYGSRDIFHSNEL